MPKITVTNTKGLVQESGTGGIKVVHSSVSGSAGVEGLRVAAGGASGFLHMVQAPAVTLGTATVTTVQALIPAGSRVLCGEITITTGTGAGGANVTSIGVTGDTDALSGTIALSVQTAGAAQKISPTDLLPTGVGNSDSATDVLITHSMLMGATVVVDLNLLCATAATTEG